VVLAGDKALPGAVFAGVDVVVGVDLAQPPGAALLSR
jgi:hypothetical protein